MVMLRPLRTKSSFLVGYLNQTSLNSILPIMSSVFGMSFFDLSLSISIALIADGCSMILKIFSAAALALPISGPKLWAVPAYEAPNMIAKRAMKMSSGLIVGIPVSSSMLFLIISPPNQNMAANTRY
jgi:hypothetical protein